MVFFLSVLNQCVLDTKSKIKFIPKEIYLQVAFRHSAVNLHKSLISHQSYRVWWLLSNHIIMNVRDKQNSSTFRLRKISFCQMWSQTMGHYQGGAGKNIIAAERLGYDDLLFTAFQDFFTENSCSWDSMKNSMHRKRNVICDLTWYRLADQENSDWEKPRPHGWFRYRLSKYDYFFGVCAILSSKKRSADRSGGKRASFITFLMTFEVRSLWAWTSAVQLIIPKWTVVRLHASYALLVANA